LLSDVAPLTMRRVARAARMRVCRVAARPLPTLMPAAVFAGTLLPPSLSRGGASLTSCACHHRAISGDGKAYARRNIFDTDAFRLFTRIQQSDAITFFLSSDSLRHATFFSPRAMRSA